MKSNRQMILATLISIIFFFVLTFALSWPILVAGLLSVGVYAGIFFISKPRVRIGNITLDTLPNGSELGELMNDAKDDILAIGDASKKIKNPKVREAGDKLYDTGIRILHYLSDNPAQISNARRFFGYYLNTTRNILEKYLTVQNSELQTEEVARITEATERTLPILNNAFDRQFTHLMKNDMMDIEADIQLLETNLKMEGF